jgi:hypothetical protein
LIKLQEQLEQDAEVKNRVVLFHIFVPVFRATYARNFKIQNLILAQNSVKICDGI